MASCERSEAGRGWVGCQQADAPYVVTDTLTSVFRALKRMLRTAQARLTPPRKGEIPRPGARKLVDSFADTNERQPTAVANAAKFLPRTLGCVLYSASSKREKRKPRNPVYRR